LSGNLHRKYERLVSAEPQWDHSAAEILDHIGQLIDVSAHFGRAEGAQRAIEQCVRLRRRASLAIEEAPVLFYFEANAWRVLWLSRAAGMVDVWRWRDEAFENEIRRLLQALRSPGFPRLDPLRRSQILTNLANALDTLGRFVEAIEIYERAIDACPDHGMARGNLGVCLAHYGYMLL
jgi:tetratricopeptide (TPR) repeat protein